jgi:hypothetical protein
MSNVSELVRLAKLGRRAEKRGEAIQGCAVAVLVSVGNAFFGGWMFMFAVAVLHAHWWSALPTVGYWWSVLTVVLMRGVFSAPRPVKRVAS